jgi:hypothetical protein
MPVTPFLIGEPFEPEDIRKMSAAFIAACQKLRLADRSDPLTEIVARKSLSSGNAASATQKRWSKGH